MLGKAVGGSILFAALETRLLATPDLLPSTLTTGLPLVLPPLYAAVILVNVVAASYAIIGAES